MNRPTHADALRATAAALVALADSLDAGPVEAPVPAGDGWADARSCSPLSRRQFLKLCASGELPSTRVGRRVVVRRADLDAHVAAGLARRSKPTKPTAGDTRFASWLASNKITRARSA